MIIQGDCLQKLKELENNSIDAIITDPPYELGFMGKKWDSTGIANNVELWKECLRVLKPGGHLLAFSGTRTYHRMASAIEDAGFEIRDMIEWVYGSGFPKSLNIGKAVDKLQGNERKVIGRNPNSRENCGKTNTLYESGTVGKTDILTKGTSEWEGWGTALKPAHEPICMARKPLAEKTVAENVLKYGTGGINIDESRVFRDKDDKSGWSEAPGKASGFAPGDDGKMDYSKPEQKDDNELGRFPANLFHDNSEEVRECFPNESERFFKSIIYQAKASKSERNKGCEEIDAQVRVRQGLAGEKKDTVSSNFHPTVKPIALMEYLIKMVTPKGGVVLDPFMGSGTTGVACKKNGFEFVGIEMEEDYIKIANARIKSQGSQSYE
jgi:DNA modification methylase